MAVPRLILFLLLFLPACQAPPAEPEPAPAPMTDAEREARVDALLGPTVGRMKEVLQGKRAGITPFCKEGAEFEPRVSGYLVPRLMGFLLDAGITVIERRDLDEVVAEIVQQLSDVMDQETRVKVGRISGVHALVMGTVQDLSLTVYRIRIKVVDVETARVLLTDNVDIPRGLLPIKHGGL